MENLIKAATEEAKKVAATIISSRGAFPPEMTQPFVMNLFAAVDYKCRLIAQSGESQGSDLSKQINADAIAFLLDALHNVIEKFGSQHSAQYEEYLAAVISSNDRLKISLDEVLNGYEQSENLFRAIKDAERLNQLKKLAQK